MFLKVEHNGPPAYVNTRHIIAVTEDEEGRTVLHLTGGVTIVGVPQSPVAIATAISNPHGE